MEASQRGRQSGRKYRTKRKEVKGVKLLECFEKMSKEHEELCPMQLELHES